MLTELRRAWHRLTYAAHRAVEARSPKWPALERAWLSDHSICAACGTKAQLQVHHIKPFHLHPELELDRGNLITLCMHTHECHLEIGHGGSWRKWNPDVRANAARVRTNPQVRAAVVAAVKATARSTD